MKYDTMNEYTMTKYFESICNSFYIAYTQVKRLEKQREELEETFSDEELKIVQSLLTFSELPNFDGLKEKYVEQKYSQEELAKKKEELEKQKQTYNEEITKIDSQLNFWSDKMWGTVVDVTRLLQGMKMKSFSIIITSEAEIVALMAVFSKEPQLLEKFANIINTQERYLKSFPTSELCQAFLRAYQLKNEKEMWQVISKYF